MSAPATTHNRAAVDARLRTIRTIATLGGLLFGYDTGVISGALPFLALDAHEGGLGLSAFQESIVTSSLTLGAAFGAIIGGRLSDRYGRKRNIGVVAIIFLFGALGCALAPSYGVLVGFRFFLGLAVGVGGTVLLSMSYILAFAASLWAFDYKLSFTVLAITYLASNTVGSVVPSPGGIGPVEIALTAGLVAAGVPSGVALSTAIVYRLVTFWIPIPIGWLSLQRLQKLGHL